MGVPKPLDEFLVAGPSDIKPLQEDMCTRGVCNPGATIIDGTPLLMLRVISVRSVEDDSFEKKHIASPRALFDPFRIRWDFERLEIDAVVNSPYSLLTLGNEEMVRPTSFSYVGVAIGENSEFGKKFSIEGNKRFLPEFEHEEFGIEDPRITKFYEPVRVDGISYSYLISYVSLSENHDISTSFALTEDFKHLQRLPFKDPRPIFFAPSKDVAVFPKKFYDNDLGREIYYALTRPNGTGYMVPSIYLSKSPDLVHWGSHKLLVKGDEKGHVGAGIPPIEVEDGWLIIDHQHRHLADGTKEYVGRAYLLDRENPLKILRKSDEILEHRLNSRDFGVEPIVENVVFPSGGFYNDGKLYLYSGLDDAVVVGSIFDYDNFIFYLNKLD